MKQYQKVEVLLGYLYSKLSQISFEEDDLEFIELLIEDRVQILFKKLLDIILTDAKTK
jgi:hypothetical protein